MNFKFFITFERDDDSSTLGRVSGTAIGQASSHMPRKEHSPDTISMLSSFARTINGKRFNSRNDSTRVIPIHIPDEIMFQLEALSVPNNCFCSYNYWSGAIGFGNTQYNATRATRTDIVGGFGRNMTFASNQKTDTYFFDFDKIKIEKDADYIFKCPDEFNEQVMEGITEFVKYEKLNIFIELCEYLNVRNDDIKLGDTEIPEFRNVNGKVSILSSKEIMIAFNMFLNDDEVLIENKELISDNIETMRQFVVEILKISNETL